MKCRLLAGNLVSEDRLFGSRWCADEPLALVLGTDL